MFIEWVSIQTRLPYSAVELMLLLANGATLEVARQALGKPVERDYQLLKARFPSHQRMLATADVAWRAYALLDPFGSGTFGIRADGHSRSGTHPDLGMLRVGTGKRARSGSHPDRVRSETEPARRSGGTEP